MISKVVTTARFNNLKELPEAAKRAERLGYDTLHVGEHQHNAFLPLLLAAEHTQRIHVATNVAIAFARSPMVTAYAAWDLQGYSGGRFELGLGTQVKAHITRRFGMEWGRPVGRLKDYILALRDIFACWQNGTKLDHQGEFYNLTLMIPYFSPGPVQNPQIPFFISAVGPQMCKLAGQVCDGISPHHFHTVKYLQDVVFPTFKAGAESAGRDVKTLDFKVGVLLASGDTEEELGKGRQRLRKDISFYASTPAYRGVLDAHGWTDLGEKLHLMSREGKWEAMAQEIPADIVEEFAVVAKYDDLAKVIKKRYKNLATAINLTLPASANIEEERLASIIKEIKSP